MLLEVERISLGPAYSLFGKASGAEVRVRVVHGGQLALAINGGAELVVRPTSITLPSELCACARIGKTGDVVALRSASALAKGADGRAERVSNDSVIPPDAAMPA